MWSRNTLELSGNETRVLHRVVHGFLGNKNTPHPGVLQQADLIEKEFHLFFLMR